MPLATKPSAKLAEIGDWWLETTARYSENKKGASLVGRAFLWSYCKLGVCRFCDLGSGGFVAIFHRSAAAEFDAAFVIDANAFHPDDVAYVDHVGDEVHAEVGQFGNVAEAVFARKDFDESAEFFDGYHAALIHFSDFDLFGHAIDDLFGASQAVAIVRVDVDGAVVVDVNLSAGFSDDAFDGFATRPDEEANFIGSDFDGFDARRIFTEFLAR